MLCKLVGASAQTLPKFPEDRLELLNDRIEALIILGGDAGTSDGVFRYGGNTRADLNITKFGTSSELTNPMPLAGLVRWAPTIVGNIGYSTSVTHLGPPFDGDGLEAKSLAAELGGGARFWFNSHLSFSPSVAGIYGHTESEYKPVSASGFHFGPELEKDGLVDWRLDTWTVVPAIDAQYEYYWHPITFTANSTFNEFHTETFSSTSRLINIKGDSQTWKNMIDLETPLGVKLFNRNVIVGSYFSRTDLFGNVSRATGSSYFYTIEGRIGLDMEGVLPFVRWIGLDSEYYWGHQFSGWSVGLGIR
jgi:hypothetical protein